MEFITRSSANTPGGRWSSKVLWYTVWINSSIYGNNQVLMNISYAQTFGLMWFIEIVLKWLCGTHWYQVNTSFMRKQSRILKAIVTWMVPSSSSLIGSYVYTGLHQSKDDAKHIHSSLNWVLLRQALCKNSMTLHMIFSSFSHGIYTYIVLFFLDGYLPKLCFHNTRDESNICKGGPHDDAMTWKCFRCFCHFVRGSQLW